MKQRKLHQSEGRFKNKKMILILHACPIRKERKKILNNDDHYEYFFAEINYRGIFHTLNIYFSLISKRKMERWKFFFSP